MKTHIKLLVIILINILYSKIFSQADQSCPFGHYRTSSSYYVGWDGINGSSGTLDIRNDWNQPIDFYTNTTIKMQLTANGNLDITNALNGFWINGNPVLWHNGDATSILVGVGAGHSTITGDTNTLVGNLAGFSISSGAYNTFVGQECGIFKHHRIYE